MAAVNGPRRVSFRMLGIEGIAEGEIHKLQGDQAIVRITHPKGYHSLYMIPQASLTALDQEETKGDTPGDPSFTKPLRRRRRDRRDGEEFPSFVR